MTLLQTDRQTDTRRESLANRLGEIISAVQPDAMAVCPNCKALVNLSKEPEICMGAVACPKCGKGVTQEHIAKNTPCAAASDHSVDITEMAKAIRRERLARRIHEIVKCANSDTTPFTPAQTKAKNAQARQLSEAIYEAAAIAAAHKIEADKKEKRKKEIEAILLLLLLAGEDAYLKIYSTLGTDGLKNADETQIVEQAKTFAASRQENLQEFAGKLRDAIGEAKAEAFGMPEEDAARHVREAAVKTSQVMIDVETTCTLGSIELDRLKRAGFVTAFWSQLDRPTKRHSHAMNQDEGIVKIGHTFSSGQKYPGDPAAGVGETINCLCQLIGVGRE